MCFRAREATRRNAKLDADIPALLELAAQDDLAATERANAGQKSVLVLSLSPAWLIGSLNSIHSVVH